jgi:intracellular sulfur oxidation DsrE/DsrF family protein
MLVDKSSVPRRSFLRTISVGSSLGAVGLLDACALHAAPVETGAAAVQPSTSRRATWDMSWVARVNRPHRVVFDVTKVSDGDALWQTTSWMQGYTEAEGATDADLNAVLVFRHAAVTMVLNDAMWTRLGVSSGRADSTASSGAKRNPYLGDAAAAPSTTPNVHGPMTIHRLMARGVIILACNNALNGQAFTLKQKESISESDAQAQIRASVADGVYVMPNGIFSVARAQEAGCALFMPG